MELIPILSLIVLVATISTFILAVGAYVLYKIRERKGRVSKAVQPAAIEAELITPAPIMSGKEASTMSTFTATEDMPTRVTETGFQPRVTRTAERKSARQPMRPTFIGTAPTRPTEEKFKRTMPKETKYQTETKFTRYTSEGSKAISKKKNDNNEKLRWR